MGFRLFMNTNYGTMLLRVSFFALQEKIVMNKIKDFFYKKNDIIIVMLIMADASFVIYDRMENIMEYPDTLAAQVAQQEAEAQETAAANTVSIEIDQDSTLSDVSNILETNGLISSADEFTKLAEDANKDGSLVPGTYDITKGTDSQTILETITK